MAAISLLLLGFVLGLKHALDVDHIAAVTTIVSGESSVRRSSLIGFSWGVGHTLMLAVVGFPVLLFHWILPVWLTHLAEAGVGVMLLYLGARIFVKMTQERIHWHAHTHSQENVPHFHAHSHVLQPDHEHPHLRKFMKRSLSVGMVHGFAGSGALTILILGSMPNVQMGILYLLLFGLGTILGMMLLTTIISLPFSIRGRSFNIVHKILTVGAGVASIVVGFLILFEQLHSFI